MRGGPLPKIVKPVFSEAALINSEASVSMCTYYTNTMSDHTFYNHTNVYFHMAVVLAVCHQQPIVVWHSTWTSLFLAY